MMVNRKKQRWESKSAWWFEQTNNPNNYFARRTELVTQLIYRYLEKGSTLDVGCGSGNLSYRLAQRGFDVFGTDLAENMIAESSRRLAALVPQASDRFRVCNDGEIPFEGQTFDMITAIDVLPYISDWPQFIHALSKFLNPDGLMVLSNTNRISPYVWLAIGEQFLRRPSGGDAKTWTEAVVNLARTGFWSGGFVDYYKANQCYNAKCLDALLDRQGFKKIDELSLYKIPFFLDRMPLKRTKIGRYFARILGWNHIGIYQSRASFAP